MLNAVEMKMHKYVIKAASRKFCNAFINRVLISGNVPLNI